MRAQAPPAPPRPSPRARRSAARHRRSRRAGSVGWAAAGVRAVAERRVAGLAARAPRHAARRVERHLQRRRRWRAVGGRRGAVGAITQRVGRTALAPAPRVLARSAFGDVGPWLRSSGRRVVGGLHVGGWGRLAACSLDVRPQHEACSAARARQEYAARQATPPLARFAPRRARRRASADPRFAGWQKVSPQPRVHALARRAAAARPPGAIRDRRTGPRIPPQRKRRMTLRTTPRSSTRDTNSGFISALAGCRRTMPLGSR
jgi:hypothetical protein